MIDVGDVVVATRNGGHDKQGLPRQRPVVGKVYRITGIYPMNYGLGCTLDGMDPRPYKGYFLYVNKEGWYFAELAKADDEFTAQMSRIREKQGAGNP